MIQVYTFDVRIMNGTVTMWSEKGIFASRDLAEKTRNAVIDANCSNEKPDGLVAICSHIEKTVVYESEEEVPILNQ